MKVAYVLYKYPALSNVFILREIQQLRKLGFEVQPYALRRSPEEVLLAAADRSEAEATISLLPVRVGRFARAHLASFLKAPSAYLRVFAGALAEGSFDLRVVARQAGAFGLAVIVLEDLRHSGCRHIHTHFAGTPSHVASLVTKLGSATDRDSRWTWSVTIHGSVEFFDVSEYRLAKRAREAEFVAYVSEFAGAQLMATIEPSQWPKLHLVRCGLDTESFDGERPARTRADRFELLTIGRLIQIKAQHVMIEAVARLRERAVNVHLTVVGDGPLRDELRQLARRLDADDSITFAGALGQDDVPGQLLRVDAFCLSSVAESLPVTLMEAMASGLPVVSTAVGGVAELVEDGANGLLVPPGDSEAFAEALERLARDQSLRDRMGTAGRERVRGFDVHESAQKLAALLRGSA